MLKVIDFEIRLLEGIFGGYFDDFTCEQMRRIIDYIYEMPKEGYDPCLRSSVISELQEYWATKDDDE